MTQNKTTGRYRLDRVRAQMLAQDVGVLLLADPINIRYATGIRNMQIWSMHTNVRYTLIFAEGPVIAFEFSGSLHLADTPQVDEIYQSISWDYASCGPHGTARASAWASQIDAMIRAHAGSERRLALDRADLPGLYALARLGYTLSDGKGVMELARSIKSPAEITEMRAAYQQCADALDYMLAALRPGVTERAMLGRFVGKAIEKVSPCKAT